MVNNAKGRSELAIALSDTPQTDRGIVNGEEMARRLHTLLMTQ